MKLKELIFLLIIIVIILPIFIWWSSETSSTSQSPITIDNYSVINQPSNFKMLWMKPNAYAHYGEAAVILAASNERLAFLGSFSKSEPNSLVSINAETGIIEWTKLSENQSSTGAKLAVFANGQLIYVIFNSIWRVPADATFGAAKVDAYQSDSGDLVWTSAIKGAESINSLMITDTTISIDGDSSANYYVFDAQTGQILKTLNKKEENFFWFSNDGILYERMRLHSFQAIDSHTGNLLWQSSFGIVFHHPPILNDGVLLLRSGESSSKGIVYALDSLTGTILWEYSGVVSNVASQDSVAYFLTLDAHLVAVNIRTGDILGTVEFSSDKFVLQDDNLFRHGFSVAVADNVVGVHLGDSQQLFAFRFLPDE